MKNRLCAAGLGIRLKRHHQGMGIENSGGRRQERSDTGHCRFKLPHLSGVQPLQVIDAIAPILFQQCPQGHAQSVIGDDTHLPSAHSRQTPFPIIDQAGKNRQQRGHDHEEDQHQEVRTGELHDQADQDRHDHPGHVAAEIHGAGQNAGF
ncbi:hypothetical protein ABH912_006292 [Pseudomonas sp. BT76 TE3572]